jgi:hypothetical protein
MIPKWLKEINFLALGAGFLVPLLGIHAFIYSAGLTLAFIAGLFFVENGQIQAFKQAHHFALLIPSFFIGAGFMLLGGYITGRIAKQRPILHGCLAGALTCVDLFWRGGISDYPFWINFIANLLVIPLGGIGAFLAQGSNEADSLKLTRSQWLKIGVMGLVLGGIPFHLAGLWIAYIPQMFNSYMLPTWKDVKPFGWIFSLGLLLVFVIWVTWIAHLLRTGLSKHKFPGLPKARLWFKAGEIFCLWLAAGLVLAPFLWHATGVVVFRSLLASVEKAGYTTRYLYTTPSLPNDKNSVFWIQMALACPSLKEMDDKNPNGKRTIELETRFISGAYEGKFDQGEIKQVQALLKGNSKAFQLIRRGAQCPASNWGKDIQVFQDDGGGFVPQRQGIKVLFMGRLLVCQALLMARKGRSEESLDLIRDGLHLAKVYESTGVLIDVMMAAAINKICLLGAPYVLERAPVRMAREKWGGLLKPDEIPQKVKNALSIEFFSYAFQQDKKKRDYWDKPTGYPNFNFYYYPFHPWDWASLLRGGKEILDSFQEPYIKAAPQIDLADKRFDRKSWWFSSIKMARFGQMYGKSLVNTAQFRMALLAMASRDYKEKNGRWPEGPKDLESTLPDPSFAMDPFSGNPLIFRKEGERLLIYSIGFDLKDEQGQETEEEKKFRTGNLIWLL